MRERDMPMWQACCLCAAVLGLVAFAAVEAVERGSWALGVVTVLLVAGLVPACVEGWRRGRRRRAERE